MLRGKSFRSKASFWLLNIITSALLLAGCSSGQSKKAAAEALNQGLHRQNVGLFISVGRLSQSCSYISGFEKDKDLTEVTNFRAAQKAGLVTIAPDGPGFWRVELVNPKPEIAENLKKAKHTVKDGCDLVGYAFKIASKAVAEVLEIHEITNEKAEVDYTWKWTLDPSGVKLVDNLTQPELIEVNANLQALEWHRQPVPTFNLADMVQSAAPHPGKAMLKKSGDDWALDQ